jgi:Response regulator containing a CheY-like receiver domain and an HD-GYP domain
MLDYSTLALTVEEILRRKDPYDHHGSNVSRLVMTMVELSNRFNAHEYEMIKWGTYLHDMGKIFIPDVILNYPRKYTRQELLTVQTHPFLGWELARSLKCDGIVLDVIYQHHENMDGSGYPRGLHGHDICIEAKFTRVADTFDAMHSKRIYREPASLSECFMLLDAEAGRIFDPDAVQFLKIAVAKLGIE